MDLRVPAPEEMSRDELIALVRAQAGRIAFQDKLIAGLVTQEGACECGAGLAGARDLGVVDQY